MYILDRKRQLLLIREMTQLRKDSNQWEVYYHHPTTNAMWKSYFPRATEQERGPKVLRTEPVPDLLEKRLENCLTKSNLENAVGLAIELSVQPEIWEQLLDIIDQNYRRYDRKLLPVFLKKLQIENYKTFFETINYTWQSVSGAEISFDNLANCSKKIRFKRFWFF